MESLLFGTSVAVVAAAQYATRQQRVEVKTVAAQVTGGASVGEPDGETTPDCATCPNGMEGSVKPYDRHVVICDMHLDWPKHIEKNAVFPYNLVSKIDGSPARDGDMRIMVTACRHIAECDERMAEVFVYPDNLVFTLDESQSEAFAALIYSKTPLHQASTFASFNTRRPFCNKLVLVCCHQDRDKRCGRIGPQIIAEMRRLLGDQGVEESEVAVRQTSHIGGHAFAGTLISYPQGTWYGKLSARNCPELVDFIRSDKVMAKCFRGRAGGQLIDW